MHPTPSLLRIPGRPVPLLAGHLPGWRHPEALGSEFDRLVDQGVRRLVCLVPSEDLEDLWNLAGYLPAARTRFGRDFLHVPMEDGGIPSEEAFFDAAVEQVDRGLLAGEPAFVHCVAGCGRTGLFAACVLVRAGLKPGEAIRVFRDVRGCGPETADQVACVFRYARRKALDEP
ncbi:MAG: dual specificity protein phosphatase family protein [Deltaproteobacteria bacterium]|nr:dual specificity protein phosphatase family protein [Deltaproteobacteria bacterium]